MRAIDVMTSGVITGGENATVPEAARLLADHGISAVPVVDKDNRVIGMVSEGDLLHRAETGTERRRSWWLDMVSSTNKLAGEYIKSHSGSVKDVMTRDVMSVTEETPVADIAILLETNRIKRVPVLRGFVPVTTISTSLAPHLEQTSRSRQSSTGVSAPKQLASRRDRARSDSRTPRTKRSTAHRPQRWRPASSAGRARISSATYPFTGEGTRAGRPVFLSAGQGLATMMLPRLNLWDGDEGKT